MTIHAHRSLTLQQAAGESPTLARLVALAQESRERLQAVAPLIPPALRGAVQAGPIDGPAWCLLVANTAAAAKLRQLLPALQGSLRARGYSVDSIRLKVQQPVA